MSTESYLTSEVYERFKAGIEQIATRPNGSFENQLYFSNVFSLLEQYLYRLFMGEISSNGHAMTRLSTLNKFQKVTVSISSLLNHGVESYLINAVKNQVWHRFNDVEVLYKRVMGIQFNVSGILLGKLNIRHHIVHRNGFDLENNPIEISDVDLRHCIEVVNDFIVDVDKKYYRYKNNLS